MTDFYFNIGKDVGFGARSIDLKKPEKHPESKKAENHPESVKPEDAAAAALPGSRPLLDPGFRAESSRVQEQIKTPDFSTSESEDVHAQRFPDIPVQEKTSVAASAEPLPAEQPKRDHKRSQDAVAAAKERFLARKKGKEQ